MTPYGGEELVDDVRSGVTPGRMIDRKVLAQQGGVGVGMVAQAAGGPSDPRRVPEVARGRSL